MRTYAETRGKPPFDWNAFLSLDEFPNDELADAVTLSGQWVTCACGNLCDALPRRDDGEPLDADLADLGWEFHSTIISMDAHHSEDNLEGTLKWRDTARSILALIEARSVVLLKPLVP